MSKTEQEIICESILELINEEKEVLYRKHQGGHVFAVFPNDTDGKGHVGTHNALNDGKSGSHHINDIKASSSSIAHDHPEAQKLTQSLASQGIKVKHLKLRK